MKEFLVSNRLASSLGDFSRYHIRLVPAHTILTQACLGLLLHSDDHTTNESIKHSPFTDYAAENWFEHAQFEDVASRVKDGMETLFDPDKLHFEAWVGIYDIDSEIYQHDSSNTPNPLYYSALCGFYALVEHLAIKHPRLVNTIGGNYRLPLLAALAEIHLGIAEFLIKHGADVDVREATGKTMLLVTISSFKERDNLINMVEFLLTHGADVNARDNASATSLHLAIQHNRLELARILLEHGADTNAESNKGQTPLHILSESDITDEGNALNLVLLLFKNGAELDKRDKDNETPLLRAIRSNLFELAGTLLEHGADSNVENNEGDTPFHILSESDIKDDRKMLNLVQLLLKKGAEVNRRDKDKETPLHLAIHRNRLMLAEVLLKNGADSIAENNEGQTPLHVLSELRCWPRDEGDILHLALSLLKHGAEVNRRGKDEETPLHLAIRCNSFKLAGILLEHRADVTAENDKGQTPLHILAGRNIADEGDVLNLPLLLLKNGAEVNSRDKDNEPPLLQAIRSDFFELAEILLEHGADANAKNDEGKTPFHVLSESNITDESDILNFVLLLSKDGAMVNRRDQDEESPLHLATRWNRFMLAKTLLEHGADVNVEDNQGQTPLHMVSDSWINDEGDTLNLALLLLKHAAEVNGRDEDNITSINTRETAQACGNPS